MKLYQIKNINEPHNPNMVMGAKLKFISAISPITGKLMPSEKQPDDWDNVERLTNMLFLAWDDSNKVEGTVYLGSLI